MNHYAEVIEILTTPDIDFRAIAIEFGKRHPKMFMDAAKLAQVGQTKGRDSWEWKVIPALKADRKIEAIKICRNETGMSLKEAKDAVEAFMKRIELAV
jgi:ribosomal protein L7/L12